MTTTKILAPVDSLFDQGYKLSYFCEDLSKYEENHLKSVDTNVKAFKSLNTWYKKDIFHVEMLVSFLSGLFQ